jgi:uncharacterized membrane protein
MATATPVPAFEQQVRATRVRSIDIIRGAVMVLMAIDHVRVFSGVPAGGPSPGVFFTRWVTHFCAPAFIFLAGTSAFLYGYRRTHLSRFLLTRGAWLVFLELTYFRVAWTFNLEFRQYELAGVILVFGWCMILMAGLVRLSVPTIGTIGVLIIAGHNLFDTRGADLAQTLTQDAASNLWRILYVGFWAGPVTLGPDGPRLTVLYSIVPWIGVMAAGYGFGLIVTSEPADRRRLCLIIGLTATALFLIGGMIALAVLPPPQRPIPAVIRLLNQQKYPASQLFLLMTLGPTIALLPLAERARGWAADALATFGRVPMFYYLLHIPTIHVAALIVRLIQEGSIHPEWYATAPGAQVPQEYRWSLPLLYLVFAMVIAFLYWPCRWFAGVKARGQKGWLSYI